MNTLMIHLAVNNANGLHTGHVDAICLYHDGITPLIDLEGYEVACGVAPDEDGHDILQVADNAMRCYGYREFVGSLVWDACRISLADAAQVVNSLREHGWTCTEGYTELFEAYHAGRDITADDLARAMQPEQVAE